MDAYNQYGVEKPLLFLKNDESSTAVPFLALIQSETIWVKRVRPWNCLTSRTSHEPPLELVSSFYHQKGCSFRANNAITFRVVRFHLYFTPKTEDGDLIWGWNKNDYSAIRISQHTDQAFRANGEISVKGMEGRALYDQLCY